MKCCGKSFCFSHAFCETSHFDRLILGGGDRDLLNFLRADHSVKEKERKMFCKKFYEGKKRFAIVLRDARMRVVSFFKHFRNLEALM